MTLVSRYVMIHTLIKLPSDSRLNSFIYSIVILQNNVSVLQTLVAWLQSSGNRQAILSETGGGNTASCETEYVNALAHSTWFVLI